MTLPRLPRMMIAFVVRRCTIELGHRPTPAEFARWANAQKGTGRLFGRPISEPEADVILRHQARLVTARSAAAHETWIEVDELAVPSAKVVALTAVRARRSLARGR